MIALRISILLPLLANVPLFGQSDFGNKVPFNLTPGKTQIHIHLGKSGLFGFLGDNHLIDVPLAEGVLYLDPTKTQPIALKFSIDTQSIRVLDPHLKADTREQVQAKMAGPEVLRVEEFPKIQFASTEIKPGDQSNTWIIQGTIEVKSNKSPIEFTTEIETEGSTFTAKGEAMLELTDLQITPPGAGAGTVKVKNQFKVEFESHGQN